MQARSFARHPGRFLLAAILTLASRRAAVASVSDARLGAVAPRALATPFAANHGRWDQRVAFAAATPAETVFVTRDGRIVHSLRPRTPRPDETACAAEDVAGWSLTESFVGGHAHLRPGATTPTKISRFVGDDPSRWSRGEATYASVELGAIWPGVRVSLDATAGAVERVFRIAPGVSEDSISVRLSGATALAVLADSSLSARTGLGDITLSAPIAYQEDARGRRTPVAVSYRVHGDRYGFRLGPHDPGLATTIDPLIRATYLGGSDRDSPTSIASNPSNGEIIVAGGTVSTDFPGTAGGAQPIYGGLHADGFVARLSGDLKTLLQATYIGGSDNDYVQDVLVNSSGEIVVLGVTRSTDLPGTTGGAVAYGGAGDNFVARFNADLTSVLQTTYFGGTGAEALYTLGGIAEDIVSGDIYISGETASTDLPGTASAAQKTSGGNNDAFVARFNSTLTSLLGATYFGGTGNDAGSHLLVETTSRDIIVVGFAESTDLPGTTGGARPNSGGGRDGFAARFDRTLTTLVKATYIGGGGTDNAIALARHGNGTLLVAGGTTSTDFPGIDGVQTDLRGGSDAFVAALKLDLTSIVHATFLGGGFGETATGVAPVSPTATTSEVYVAGTTNSYDFPGTAGGAQSQAHASDVFLARMMPDLSAIEIATYVGGRGGESNAALAVEFTTAEPIVAGETTSPSMPGTDLAAQPTPGIGTDGFVARFDESLAAAPVPSGLVPVNLVVDYAASGASDGNQVFEPGETVLVAPFWRDIAPLPLSATGAATAFTGPAGPTYTTPDAAAAYETADPGQTTNCASSLNCYSFTVGAARPSTHWDATFHETLSSGAAKIWTLHVGDSFIDVPRSQPFYKKIETLVHVGVTTGCSPTQYCPGQAVQRDQMAIFIAKVLAGGGANVPVIGQVNGSDYRCGGGLSGISLFTDVSPSDPACKHIHYIAAQNITLGCSATQFCPTGLVNRDGMAAFIAKAYVAPNGAPYIPASYGPDPVTGLSYSCDVHAPNTHFSDVPISDPFCKFVHYLWARGFIGGCSPTAFCPTDNVGRDAMAKFLVNAFDLKLYGP